MEEVTDEPLYRDRVCGIDIGKAGLVATIRVPSDRDPARRMQETRSFGTTKKEVLTLADWLRCWQVPAVVMEATGDYWKGPFAGWRPRGSTACWLMRSRSRTCPGGPSGTRPIRGGWRRASARRHHVLFRSHPGVPDHPAAHPLPAGPDREERTRHGEPLVPCRWRVTDLSVLSLVRHCLVADADQSASWCWLRRWAGRRRGMPGDEAAINSGHFT